MPENQLLEKKSEVAALLSKIRVEYESAELGLTGLSQGSSQHKVMTAKTERIADLHLQLQEIAGDEAMALVANMLDQAAQSGNTAP